MSSTSAPARPTSSLGVKGRQISRVYPRRKIGTKVAKAAKPPAPPASPSQKRKPKAPAPTPSPKAKAGRRTADTIICARETCKNVPGKDVLWGGYTVTMGADGALCRKAKGNACGECWVVFLCSYEPCGKEWQDVVHDCNHDTEKDIEFEEAKLRKFGTHPADFWRATLTKLMQCGVRYHVPMKGVTAEVFKLRHGRNPTELQYPEKKHIDPPTLGRTKGFVVADDGLWPKHKDIIDIDYWVELSNKQEEYFQELIDCIRPDQTEKAWDELNKFDKDGENPDVPQTYVNFKTSMNVKHIIIRPRWSLVYMYVFYKFI